MSQRGRFWRNVGSCGYESWQVETCREEGKEIWHGAFLEFNKLVVRYMILNEFYCVEISCCSVTAIAHRPLHNRILEVHIFYNFFFLVLILCCSLNLLLRLFQPHMYNCHINHATFTASIN
jgi:hypothetical protein